MLCWSLLCLPGGWDAGTPHCHMVQMLPWGRSRLDDSKKTCPVKPIPHSAHSWAICKLRELWKARLTVSSFPQGERGEQGPPGPPVYSPHPSLAKGWCNSFCA